MKIDIHRHIVSVTKDGYCGASIDPSKRTYNIGLNYDNVCPKCTRSHRLSITRGRKNLNMLRQGWEINVNPKTRVSRLFNPTNGNIIRINAGMVEFLEHEGFIQKTTINSRQEVVYGLTKNGLNYVNEYYVKKGL